MRFHVLGLPHTQTTREYSACAFTQKVRLLCRMLHERGHEVIHYGVEGSNPACAENVPVVPLDLFERDHRSYDWRVGFIISDRMPSSMAFVANAIEQVGARKQRGDIMCATFGTRHKPVADAHPDLTVVESGIGYGRTFARYRVFESYAWMAFTHGRECERRQDAHAEFAHYEPEWYEAVIPNYLDPADYPPPQEKGPYAIHLGRATRLKGLDVALRACQEVGIPLAVAGQQHADSPRYRNLGVLSIEERARWVGRAVALLAPTQYVEPFGTVAIEAMALGTPVITTDWGAFAETVIHGVTGWRCRTLGEFTWALRHAGDIDPWVCREHALRTYGIERVGAMYESYFRAVAAHVESGGGSWDDEAGVDLRGVRAR